MPGITPTGAVLACLLALAGCTVARPYETVRVVIEGGTVLEGWGYASRVHRGEGALFAEIRVELTQAPPFLIRLPDGQAARSDAIEREFLLAHSLRPARIGDREVLTWHEPRSIGWLANQYYYYEFWLDGDGRAATLKIGICGHRDRAVFMTLDGRASFGFPLRLVDIEQLLGAPAQVKRDVAVAGFSCL
ncbi:MAG: hypothetical protein JSR54_12430 [Proteobacteria bacterium]|nr:hypothetical protein [Pseudomonadota bacterium]